MASIAGPNLRIVGREMSATPAPAGSLLMQTLQRERKEKLAQQLILNADVRKRWIEADPMWPICDGRTSAPLELVSNSSGSHVASTTFMSLVRSCVTRRWPLSLLASWRVKRRNSDTRTDHTWSKPEAGYVPANTASPVCKIEQQSSGRPIMMSNRDQVEG